MFNTDDRVLILEGNDPACNLAVEEALLSVCNSKSPDFDPLVLFYVNAPSIIVGKFQNPWLECDTAWTVSQNIPVLRRVSGGGTVWHDFGNINYSFVLPRRTFDQKADLAALEKIFRSLGIDAVSNDRGDLLLDGFKFSGNAMCYKNHAVLHHGTILIDSDLDRLRRALKVPLPHGLEIDSIGVKSKPAPVTSLGKLAPRRTTKDWIAELAAGLSMSFGGKIRYISIEELQTWFGSGSTPIGGAWQALRSKYNEWEWNFGHTPRFRVQVPERRVSWSVENGLVRAFTNPAGKELLFDPAPRFSSFEQLKNLEAIDSAA